MAGPQYRSITGFNTNAGTAATQGGAELLDKAVGRFKTIADEQYKTKLTAFNKNVAADEEAGLDTLRQINTQEDFDNFDREAFVSGLNPNIDRKKINLALDTKQDEITARVRKDELTRRQDEDYGLKVKARKEQEQYNQVLGDLSGYNTMVGENNSQIFTNAAAKFNEQNQKDLLSVQGGIIQWNDLAQESDKLAFENLVKQEGQVQNYRSLEQSNQILTQELKNVPAALRLKASKALSEAYNLDTASVEDKAALTRKLSVIMTNKNNAIKQAQDEHTIEMSRYKENQTKSAEDTVKEKTAYLSELIANPFDANLANWDSEDVAEQATYFTTHGIRIGDKTYAVEMDVFKQAIETNTYNAEDDYLDKGVDNEGFLKTLESLVLNSTTNKEVQEFRDAKRNALNLFVASQEQKAAVDSTETTEVFKRALGKFGRSRNLSFRQRLEN